MFIAKIAFQFVVLTSGVLSSLAIGGCQQETDPSTTKGMQVPFLSDDLASSCRNADRKGSYELAADEFREFNDAITFLSKMDSLYRERASAARNRDDATFRNSDTGLVNKANLVALVSENLSHLSDNATDSWRMYAKTYDSKRSDFRRKSFSDPALDSFLSPYPVDEIRKSATIGNIPFGQLLAAEARLRLIRRELEVIWLLDIAVNSVVIELKEDELRQLPLDVTQTFLRATELRKKSTVYAEPVEGLSSFKPQEFVPTPETKAEYRARYSWLKNGPDSERLEQAIKTIEAIRKKQIPYNWPETLADSYFKERDRPVFENPFDNAKSAVRENETDKGDSKSLWQID